MGEQTIEELEATYKGLLREQIQSMQSGTNHVSRLETPSRHQNSMMQKVDTVELQEIFRDKEGLELTGQSYETIISNLTKGKYRNKHVTPPGF